MAAAAPVPMVTAAAQAANAVDRKLFEGISSTVHGRYPAIDWLEVADQADKAGVCLFLSFVSLGPEVHVLAKKKVSAALAALVEYLDSRDACPDAVKESLKHKSAPASFQELVKGLRTAHARAAAETAAAATETVEANRTRRGVPPSAEKGPAPTSGVGVAKLSASFQPGYASQLMDLKEQTGGQGFNGKQLPPMGMFTVFMQLTMIDPPTIGELREIAPDLYKPKAARWNLLRIFLDQVLPALALTYCSLMGGGILLYFGPGTAADELDTHSMAGPDGAAVRVGLKVSALYAFQGAVRTLSEGGDTAMGLSPASALATIESIWNTMNTFIKSKSGSLTACLNHTQEVMVVVAAPSDKKGGESDRSKSEGKKRATDGGGSTSSSKSPRFRDSDKKRPKEKKEKKASRKRRKVSTSSSSSESESESGSESDHSRDAGPSRGRDKKKSKDSKSRDRDDKKKKKEDTKKRPAMMRASRSTPLSKSDKSESKDKKKSAKRGRSPSPSSGSSSSSDSDSYNSDLGGSRTSIMPCYREAYDRGGCDRGSECPFSHRPRLIKEARAKGRGSARK